MEELKSGLETQSRQLQIAEANVREIAASIEQFKGAIALCSELIEAEGKEDGEGDNS
jgi:hypothetical protein|tara:strand:- start:310 stop:480 length:171 start_codon:yes stop_codon:yes gene_type:complete